MADYTEQRFDYSEGRADAPELIIMVGVSGSGKSVIAKQWVNAGRSNVVRFNRDSLRTMLYVDVPWSSHNEELTRKYERDGIRLALRMGRDVIVDDTNCSVRVRHELEEIARDCRVRFRLVVMSTPIEICIERDFKREGKERVGEGVIKKQHKDLSGIAVSPKAYNLTALSRAILDREAFCTGEFTRRLQNAPFVICDIDGTLADHEGIRSPFDESKVLLDKCHTVVANWVRALYPHYNVVVVSGRHNTCGADTEEWLNEHGVPYDALLMREAGDNRSDVVIKNELLSLLLGTVSKQDVAFALDDRPRVIEGCWKANGIRVFPVRGTTYHTEDCTFEQTKGYKECPNCGALEDF